MLVLGACGGSGSSPNGSGGAPGSGGSSSSSGGATGSGGAVSSGGKTGSGGAAASGGTAGSDGAASSGGKTSSGGVTGSGGESFPPPGGKSGSGGSGGHTGGAGGSAPGSGGAGGSVSGGGGATASGCTREFLKSTVDAYFTALAAHSSATLPLASNVKVTENGKVLTVGQDGLHDGLHDGLWKTAGTLKGAHSALDTTSCSTASEAVVPDGTMDIPYALRLKLVNQQITEIETIAVHPGDYQVSGSAFASDTGAILMSDMTVHWEQAVPLAMQNTYTELTSWIDKYFRVFPAGVCNTASSCKRLENGGGSFSCSAGASCQAGMPAGTPVLKSHAIFADTDSGIGVGFDDFMGNCDMHIFKMYGGMVYQVDAVLGACSSTGWD